MARRNPVSMYELGKGAVMAAHPWERQRAWGGLSKRAARATIDALAEVDEVDYPVTSEAIEEFRRGVRDALGKQNPRGWKGR